MTGANSVPAVKLGDELSVSAIGFGAMALTPVYGEVDDTESLATLHRSAGCDARAGGAGVAALPSRRTRRGVGADSRHPAGRPCRGEPRLTVGDADA
jgi:hypothetical protein